MSSRTHGLGKLALVRFLKRQFVASLLLPKTTHTHDPMLCRILAKQNTASLSLSFFFTIRNPIRIMLDHQTNALFHKKLVKTLAKS